MPNQHVVPNNGQWAVRPKGGSLRLRSTHRVRQMRQIRARFPACGVRIRLTTGIRQSAERRFHLGPADLSHGSSYFHPARAAKILRGGVYSPKQQRGGLSLGPLVE